MPLENRVLHFIQDIPVHENQWYSARTTSAVNKLEVLQVKSEEKLKEGGVEFSSDENNGDEQEIFMTPTGTPEGYGQIRNKYFPTDRLQLQQTIARIRMMIIYIVTMTLHLTAVYRVCGWSPFIGCHCVTNSV